MEETEKRSHSPNNISSQCWVRTSAGRLWGCNFPGFYGSCCGHYVPALDTLNGSARCFTHPECHTLHISLEDELYTNTAVRPIGALFLFMDQIVSTTSSRCNICISDGSRRLKISNYQLEPIHRWIRVFIVHHFSSKICAPDHFHDGFTPGLIGDCSETRGFSLDQFLWTCVNTTVIDNSLMRNKPTKQNPGAVCLQSENKRPDNQNKDPWHVLPGDRCQKVVGQHGQRGLVP